MRTLRTYLPEDTARRDVARAFDDACAASGLSNESIGAALGVGEKAVRKMRSGEMPIPTHRQAQLPESVAVLFAAGVKAVRERHHAPLTAQTVEAQAATLGAAAAGLAEEILKAFNNDGRIDADELVRIAEKYGAVVRADHGLRVLRGRCP